MRKMSRRVARTLGIAALAAAVALSCPIPIDEDLLLVVDDEIAPDLAITEPSANSYYHGTMRVAGSVADSSGEPGDGRGRVHTLSFTVSDELPLARTVTFDADGVEEVSPPDPSFSWDAATGSFSFDVGMDGIQGYKVMTFVATDANGNETRRDVPLLPYPYGPNLVLTSPADLSVYDMVVAIEGTVTDAAGVATTDEVKALKWEATGEPARDLVLGPATKQPDGTYLSGTFSYDPATGAYNDWFDSSAKTGTIMLKVSAQNGSLVWSAVTVMLVFNGTGPAITLAPAAAGHNPEAYSSLVTAAITVDGTVDMTNLKPGSLRYFVKQPVGLPQTGGITPDGVGAFSFTFAPGGTPQLSGNLTIEVSALDNRNIESKESFVCYDDQVPPAAPSVSGPSSPTNDDTPTWTWTTPATTADFQYSLDSSSGPWTTTAATSWTPPALGDGAHTLYVRARDAVGNASEYGSDSLVVDTVPPSAPSVSGPSSPTNVNTPTWTWTTPTGTVELRRSLDSPSGPWTTTSATSWTAPPLSDGLHTLYVQGRDAAGNWSGSGSDGVTIDTTPPPAPTVSGETPTTETRPTWTWDTPGDATGFRRSLDGGGWVTTGGTSYTPSSALDLGSHTLSVQARDALDNWSGSGSHTIVIVEP